MSTPRITRFLSRNSPSPRAPVVVPLWCAISDARARRHFPKTFREVGGSAPGLPTPARYAWPVPHHREPVTAKPHREPVTPRGAPRSYCPYRTRSSHRPCPVSRIAQPAACTLASSPASRSASGHAYGVHHPTRSAPVAIVPSCQPRTRGHLGSVSGQSGPRGGPDGPVSRENCRPLAIGKRQGLHELGRSVVSRTRATRQVRLTLCNGREQRDARACMTLRARALRWGRLKGVPTAHLVGRRLH